MQEGGARCRRQSSWGRCCRSSSRSNLVAQKRLSLQTIASYRDTFRLLLQFVHRETSMEPVALPVATLDADRVLAFLDRLEKERHNTITSRNLRLTAIRSFFRMVALREPPPSASLPGSSPFP